MAIAAYMRLRGPLQRYGMISARYPLSPSPSVRPTEGRSHGQPCTCSKLRAIKLESILSLALWPHVGLHADPPPPQELDELFQVRLAQLRRKLRGRPCV